MLDEIKRHLARVVVYGGLVAAVVMWLRVKDIEIPDNAPLPPKVLTRVKVVPGKNTVTVRTRVKTVVKYVPRDGEATIDTDEDGGVSIVVKDRGLSLRPGLGVVYYDRIAPAVDVRLAYWRRFGAGIGTAVHPKLWYYPYGYVNYTVYGNGSLFVGMAANRMVVFGLRTEF
jgi:hypothetical protein